MQIFTTFIAAAALLCAATPAPAQAANAPTVAARPRAAGALQHGPSLLQGILAAVQAKGATKQPAGHLNLPYGIALDPDGNLYVANVLGNNVAIYNAKHQFSGAITANLSFPVAVGVTAEDDIVVASNTSPTINFYNQSLAQIATITDPALTNTVMIAVDQDDTTWALDSAGTLHAYLIDGTILPPAVTGGTTVGLWGANTAVWGVPDNAGGLDEIFGNRALSVRYYPSLYEEFQGASPAAGAQTTDGANLQYITDTATNQVEIWSATGLNESPIGAFPVPSEPIGIAVDTVRKRIYVAFPFLNEVITYSQTAPYKQLAVIH